VTVDTIGRWNDILGALGVDRKFLTNRNGPCPMCAGKDRFRFDDRDGRGTFFCSHCGAGDGFGFIKMFARVDFLEAAKMVEGVVGACSIRPHRTSAGDESAIDYALSIWRQCSPLTETSVAGRYLMRRCGYVPRTKALRQIDNLRHRDGGAWPGMVGLIRDPEGAPVGVSRTYLALDGSGKAPISLPRMFAGRIYPGSAVRLGPASEAMGAAEGIETSLVFAARFRIATWALLSAENLSEFEPPQDVSRLVIGGDNDLNFVGQAAAYKLAKRVCRRIDTEVMLPPNPGDDWADVPAPS
jgi:putative DNA primase/helicase